MIKRGINALFTSLRDYHLIKKLIKTTISNIKVKLKYRKLFEYHGTVAKYLSSAPARR